MSKNPIQKVAIFLVVFLVLNLLGYLIYYGYQEYFLAKKDTSSIELLPKELEILSSIEQALKEIKQLQLNTMNGLGNHHDLMMTELQK